MNERGVNISLIVYLKLKSIVAYIIVSYKKYFVIPTKRESPKKLKPYEPVDLWLGHPQPSMFSGTKLKLDVIE